MKLALALVTAITWMGCTTAPALPSGGGGGGGDDDPTNPGGGSNPGDPGDGTGPVTEVSGHITASTTWMNTVHLVGSVTIDAGKTLTVAAGTTVDFGTGFGIAVSGTLDIQGTKASKAVFRSATPTAYWGEITVPSGGVVTASYLVMTGGAIMISNSGKMTLVNTAMSHYPSDLLTMSGGNLDMSYSQIGLDQGQHDLIHCAMHVSGAPNISVTHSNIGTSTYGIMLLGGTNSMFLYDNWYGNGNDVYTETPHPSSGNFSHSYFPSGAPTNPGVSVTDMKNARVPDAGVQ